MGSEKAYEGYRRADFEHATNFIKFRRSWVKERMWANLPLCAKSVFLPLLLHDHGKGESWPGMERLCQLGGVCENTARRGIGELTGFELIQVRKERKRTHEGQRVRHYYTINKRGAGEDFWPFPASALTGRGWAQLQPTARALYPVLGAFSYLEMPENYDFPLLKCIGRVRMSYGDMCHFAGITRPCIRPALDSLIDWGFIEEEGGGSIILKGVNEIKGLKSDFDITLRDTGGREYDPYFGDDD